MFPTIRPSNWGSLATITLFAVALGGQGETQALVMEMEEGQYILLAGESESCTNACSSSGLTCSHESLQAAAAYGTKSAIEATVSAIGGDCGLVTGERDGKPYPLIDARDRCFPSTGKYYDCDFISTMSQPGRRICGCFGEPGNPTEAPRSPTKSPTSSLTMAPTPSDPSNSPYVPDGYKLSWRDDFGGPDIDTTNWSRGLVYDQDPSLHVVWNPRTGGPHLLNDNYEGYILDEDSYVEDGKLVLANREHSPPIQGTAPAGDHHYSTGWVNSLRKRYFDGSKKPLYLEVKAQFPEGLKVWPAIWLVSERLVWPPEIDIWEYFGCFFNPNWGVDEMHLRNIWGEWPSKETHNIEINFHEHYSGFVTLGWLWTPDVLTWYVNGEEVATKIRGVDIPNDGWPNEDMFLILNNGLMNGVDGATTSFPNYFEIDYIALYEESDDVGEPPEAEYVVLLGEAGESCASACSRNGLRCTIDSLLHGDEYTSSSGIREVAAAVGRSSCTGGVHGEKDWDVNPLISAEDYCFPTPVGGRNNQNCDAESTLETGSGELQGHRICTCETDGALVE